jgi:hypothetical protein
MNVYIVVACATSLFMSSYVPKSQTFQNRTYFKLPRRHFIFDSHLFVKVFAFFIVNRVQNTRNLILILRMEVEIIFTIIKQQPTD